VLLRHAEIEASQSRLYMSDRNSKAPGYPRASYGRIHVTDHVHEIGAAVEKHLRAEGIAGHLQALEAAFTGLAAFDSQSTEAALRTVADARGVRAPILIHATRVAITGRSVSPGLFEVAALLGRERTHARLCAAVRLIS